VSRLSTSPLSCPLVKAGLYPAADDARGFGQQPFAGAGPADSRCVAEKARREFERLAADGSCSVTNELSFSPAASMPGPSSNTRGRVMPLRNPDATVIAEERRRSEAAQVNGRNVRAQCKRRALAFPAFLDRHANFMGQDRYHFNADPDCAGHVSCFSRHINWRILRDKAGAFLCRDSRDSRITTVDDQFRQVVGPRSPARMPPPVRAIRNGVAIVLGSSL
jgi:hypothetical protein